MQSNGNVKTLGNKKSNNGFVERNTERLKRHNFRKKLFAYFDFVMVFNFFDHKVESRSKTANCCHRHSNHKTGA